MALRVNLLLMSFGSRHSIFEQAKPEVKLRRHRALVTLLAALACAGSARLSAQQFGWHQYLIPDGQTVYDVVNQVTWLADANLAKTFRFGLPLCATSSEVGCVNASGSMNYGSATAWVAAMNAAHYLGNSTWQLPTTPMTEPCAGKPGSGGNSFGFDCEANALGYLNNASAVLFISAMNAYDNGAGYLGQTTWMLPEVNPTACPLYGCVGMINPMGSLFYDQFHITAGNPVVEAPAIPVGPFFNLQPSQYWTCEAGTIPAPCDSSGATAGGMEFGFSFGDGYLGTANPPADHLVMVYYVGCDLPDQRLCKMVP